MLRSPTAFRRFALATLVVTVFVILWGGFVRASGSGAGCGDHWPLCNGEIVPRAASVETLIEMTHRLTSGVVMLMALAVFVWARRAYPKEAHPRGTSGAAVRRYAGWSLFFMGTEAAVGAGLVLLEYVAYNVSVARGYWMAAHLVNTFLLLGAQTLTLHAAYGGLRPRVRGALGAGLVATLAATVVLGMSGAIAALGDTLTLGGGIDPASDPVVGALVGLRIVHPLLACAVVLIVLAAVWRANAVVADPLTRTLGGAVVGLFLVQMGIGLANVQLMAPVWMQIVHLFVTDVIWVALVLFVARALSIAPPDASASAPVPEVGAPRPLEVV